MSNVFYLDNQKAAAAKVDTAALETMLADKVDEFVFELMKEHNASPEQMIMAIASATITAARSDIAIVKRMANVTFDLLATANSFFEVATEPKR